MLISTSFCFLFFREYSLDNDRVKSEIHFEMAFLPSLRLHRNVVRDYLDLVGKIYNHNLSIIPSFLSISFVCLFVCSVGWRNRWSFGWCEPLEPSWVFCLFLYKDLQHKWKQGNEEEWDCEEEEKKNFVQRSWFVSSIYSLIIVIYVIRDELRKYIEIKLTILCIY